MDEQRKQVCDNCAWWASEEGREHGQCRRVAPRSVAEGGCGWPKTHRSSWCGDWMLRLEEPGMLCDEAAAAVLSEARHSPEYMRAVEESKAALMSAMDRLRTSSGAVDFPLEEAEALSWVWRALETAALRIGEERGVSLARAYAEQRRQWEGEQLCKEKRAQQED